MYIRSFPYLNWTVIRNQHTPKWEKLRDLYGLCPANYSSPPTLKQLASDCVNLCGDLLFSAFCGDTDVFDDTSKQRLSIGLVDHLIVTFAYRFYWFALLPHGGGQSSF